MIIKLQNLHWKSPLTLTNAVGKMQGGGGGWGSRDRSPCDLSGAFYALVEKLVSHYRPHGMNKALTVCFCLRRRQQYMQHTKAT